MSELIDQRRYLTNFDATRTGHILADVLVIGSGVAGTCAALEASANASVTLITKGSFTESSTAWAQGGIAAAFARDDSPQSHRDDTLRVGCGVCNPDAVEQLVTDGPAAIEELLRWGLPADYEGGDLALGREGGHSHNRVVHALGDQTGRALVETLEHRVRNNQRIRIFEHCFLVDLLTDGPGCVGGVTFHPRHGHQLIWARTTVLASGGCGQLWRETTNPQSTTGDGLAAAFRAGAAMRDLEFMQFHPTTLYVAGSGRALISEAVRGEGAHLVDKNGTRFMPSFHPDAELAPRDVVSRAIYTYLTETRSHCVYLDVRHLKGFADRFPHIAKLCAEFQIDIRRDLIPVRPSAHYLVGGIETDLDGATSINGLYCCGEAASTGVHGANRMASNSLLEGLVFGKRAGAQAGRVCEEQAEPVRIRRVCHQMPPSQRTLLDIEDIRSSLRSLMGRNVGIVRGGDRLAETCDIFRFWSHYALDKTLDDPTGWELQNMLTLGRLIAESARERTESIGVHFRSDDPQTGNRRLYHTRVQRDADGMKIHRVPAP